MCSCTGGGGRPDNGGGKSSGCKRGRTFPGGTVLFPEAEMAQSSAWGGSALLAFEHVWHGEITPWFPFLTAAGNPADAAEMLQEMATAGVGMAALCTAVWGVMLVVSARIEKRKEQPLASE